MSRKKMMVNLYFNSPFQLIKGSGSKIYILQYMIEVYFCSYVSNCMPFLTQCHLLKKMLRSQKIPTETLRRPANESHHVPARPQRRNRWCSPREWQGGVVAPKPQQQVGMDWCMDGLWLPSMNPKPWTNNMYLLWALDTPGPLWYM